MVFDYFDVEDRPVIIDRREGVAWEWSRGEWRDAPDRVDTSYALGIQLDREAFVQLFPYAALNLLDWPKA